MMPADHVANYFLAVQDEDAGELISNLKLQKLCYYAQGFHLALFDCPLFPEAVLAWKHGPVIEELWHKYNKYGSNAIPKPTDVDFRLYDDQTKELLDEVYSVYGQYSAWKLRNMIHEEPPWFNAQEGGNIISPEAMSTYFKTLLDNPAPLGHT